MNKIRFFMHDVYKVHKGAVWEVVNNEGIAGYGAFWALIEVLYREKGKCKMEYLDLIAEEYYADEGLLRRIIDNCELFESDGEYFWSPEVLRDLAEREERMVRARAMAKLRRLKEERGG